MKKKNKKLTVYSTNPNFEYDEDNHEDIIAKALRGQGISKSSIAESVNVERSAIERILRGEVLEDVIIRIAPVLGLDSEKLLISDGDWK